MLMKVPMLVVVVGVSMTGCRTQQASTVSESVKKSWSATAVPAENIEGLACRVFNYADNEAGYDKNKLRGEVFAQRDSLNPSMWHLTIRGISIRSSNPWLEPNARESLTTLVSTRATISQYVAQGCWDDVVANGNKCYSFQSIDGQSGFEFIQSRNDSGALEISGREMRYREGDFLSNAGGRIADCKVVASDKAVAIARDAESIERAAAKKKFDRDVLALGELEGSSEFMSEMAVAKGFEKAIFFSHTPPKSIPMRLVSKSEGNSMPNHKYSPVHAEDEAVVRSIIVYMLRDGKMLLDFNWGPGKRTATAP